MALAAVIGVVLTGTGVILNLPRPESVIGTAFDPGYLISDSTFTNSRSMTEGQIESFLVSKGGVCVDVYGVACLSGYRVTTPTMPASPTGNCAAYPGAANESAAAIIAKVARVCRINPQVLIVLLQKEQGLVTATSPSPAIYQKAAGYRCPDTSVCDAQYYGFFNQVYKAAWQFRQYTLFPHRHYRIGTVMIAYHPASATCGQSEVRIANQATADLYNYTPYQPNAAAIANPTGKGDACSSYGNRNFWVYFSSWFGPPTNGIDALGSLPRE